VKFPVTIRYRSARVRSYAPAKNFDYYRISWAAAGKNHRRTFKTYSEAKAHAKRLARELAHSEHGISDSEVECGGKTVHGAEEAPRRNHLCAPEIEAGTKPGCVAAVPPPRAGAALSLRRGTG